MWIGQKRNDSRPVGGLQAGGKKAAPGCQGKGDVGEEIECKSRGRSQKDQVQRRWREEQTTGEGSGCHQTSAQPERAFTPKRSNGWRPTTSTRLKAAQIFIKGDKIRRL